MEGSDYKKQQKPKSKHFSIDYGKLEADLQKQIQEDELYWLRNDAKLRAVTQGTPTYEDFRQIVLAAHLKPISKEEKEELQKKSSAGQVVWNPMAGGEGNTTKCTGTDGSASYDESTSATKAPCNMPIPATTTEFTKFWRSLENYALKWRYLKCLLSTQTSTGRNPCTSGTNLIETNAGENIRALATHNVFQRICEEEVPPEICSEIITCLLKVVTADEETGDKEITSSVTKPDEDEGRLEDWKNCVHALYIVSISKRYRLTLSFLSEEDTKNLNDVMHTLRGHLTEPREEEEGGTMKELQGEAKILLDLFNVTESRIFPANHSELK